MCLSWVGVTLPDWRAGPSDGAADPLIAAALRLTKGELVCLCPPQPPCMHIVRGEDHYKPMTTNRFAPASGSSTARHVE